MLRICRLEHSTNYSMFSLNSIQSNKGPHQEFLLGSMDS